MQTTHHLPPSEEVGELFSSLYGLKITAKPSSTGAGSLISAFAEYVDASGVTRGFIACDLAGAAKLGAALTHIPMGAVEDTLESGTLPANLSDNLAEVFNIVVNLFPECHRHRMVLSRAVFGEAAATAFGEHTGTECSTFELDVQRYGTGLLLIATPG